jgi:hypothetical protein
VRPDRIKEARGRCEAALREKAKTRERKSSDASGRQLLNSANAGESHAAYPEAVTKSCHNPADRNQVETYLLTCIYDGDILFAPPTKLTSAPATHCLRPRP